MSYSFELPTHQERFYKNLIDFGYLIKELLSICHSKGCNVINPVILTIGINYVANMDKVKIIENFIEYSHLVWDKIVSRDETFFADKENGKKLFSELPIDIVEQIYVLLISKDSNGNSIITEEDKNSVWDYADSWVKICIKYIHDKRKPKLIQRGDNKYEMVYTNKYQTEINVQKYAKQYLIELDC